MPSPTLLVLLLVSLTLVVGLEDVVFPVLPDLPHGAITLDSFTVTRPMQCSISCAKRSDCCYTDVDTADDGIHTCTLYKQEGDYCHARLRRSVYGSCSDALANTGVKEGQFLITPSLGHQSREVSVKCKIIDKESHAVFDHNLAASTQWIGPAESVQLNISYANSLADIRFIMDNSGTCKQHLSLQCSSSRITPYGKAYWVSAWKPTGKRTFYPSSYPTADTECHCKLHEDCCCGRNNNACDCDSNTDGTLRSGDHGYFINKNIIPIVQFNFKDVDTSDNYGYVSLGSLLCKN